MGAFSCLTKAWAGACNWAKREDRSCSRPGSLEKALISAIDKTLSSTIADLI